MLFSFFIITISFGLFNNFFSPAWVCCYAIGFVLGANKGYFDKCSLLILFGLLALVCNGVQIYIDYILIIKFDGFRAVAYKYFTAYNHTFLGVSLFLFFKIILNQCHWTKMKKTRMLLDVIDHHSYEWYLVHQLVILGPFSLMALTHTQSLNIVLVVLVIMLMTVTLKFIDVFVMKNIKVIRRNRV